MKKATKGRVSASATATPKQIIEFIRRRTHAGRLERLVRGAGQMPDHPLRETVVDEVNDLASRFDQLAEDVAEAMISDAEKHMLHVSHTAGRIKGSRAGAKKRREQATKQRESPSTLRKKTEYQNLVDAERKKNPTGPIDTIAELAGQRVTPNPVSKSTIKRNCTVPPPSRRRSRP